MGDNRQVFDVIRSNVIRADDDDDDKRRYRVPLTHILAASACVVFLRCHVTTCSDAPVVLRGSNTDMWLFLEPTRILVMAHSY